MQCPRIYFSFMGEIQSLQLLERSLTFRTFANLVGVNGITSARNHIMNFLFRKFYLVESCVLLRIMTIKCANGSLKILEQSHLGKRLDLLPPLNLIVLWNKINETLLMISLKLNLVTLLHLCLQNQDPMMISLAMSLNLLKMKEKKYHSFQKKILWTLLVNYSMEFHSVTCSFVLNCYSLKGRKCKTLS